MGISKSINVMELKKQLIIFLLFCLSIPLFTTCKYAKNTIHVCGNGLDDITKVIQKDGDIEVIFHDTPAEAVKKANKGDAIMVLSDQYPYERVQIDESFFKEIQNKNIRAYIEFPQFIPDSKVGDIQKTSLERAVVCSSFFQNRVDSMSILIINGLQYIDVDCRNGKNHIVASKIAGFDKALYGLSEKQSPILLELPVYGALVSTTSLSRFYTGRFSPNAEWNLVWNTILEYLLPKTKDKKFTWKSTVAPTYNQTEALPVNFRKNAISRGIEWYKNSRVLISSDYEDTLSYTLKNWKGTYPRIKWNKSIPIGDGSNGLLECIFSEIDETGSQPIGIIKRGDCITETSMAFALAGKLFENKEYITIAQNLLDFYLFNSDALAREYGDPKHSAYGLIPWGISNHDWYKANYGDDNARFLLAAITTSAILQTDRWDDILMRSFLALLRTTGQKGFRGSRIDLADLEKNGWKYYFDREIINLAPHYECYLWACYLWAYNQTKDSLFLNRAKTGIRIMMENYPDNWIWTNGLSQEKARMILPLSWLLRVENTDENKNLLIKVANDVIDLQDISGAIREELGDLKKGKYPPPLSNKDYGTNEASLIAKNGDPVTDLLYTVNFALLGLHEAAYTTGDPIIKEAEKKLVEFLSRIQVSSENHPELDGGWMRAFDYQRFEHWASNADHGWGAWVIETGWTQAWIIAIFSLYEMNTSIWDLTQKSSISINYQKFKKEMLPN